MEFEDILLDVGDNGKYQWHLIILFLGPACLCMPWFTMSVLFMISLPDHWCYVPEVASSNLSMEIQKSLIRPPTDPTCSMYNVSYADLLSSGVHTVPNDSTIIPCTQGWQYDKTDHDYTASTQFNLVCEDMHFISLIFTMQNLGSVVGTPIYGALSDKIGRKIVFFITLAVTLVSSIVMVFMPTLASFIVLKAIHGSIMPCLFQLPFIIILELLGPEVRTRLNSFGNIAWAVGTCILPLIAFGARNWITLGLSTGCVSVLFFLHWWFIPESPRWLLSQERFDEAVEIMAKIGKKNGKPQDNAVLLLKLQKLGDKMKKQKEVDGIQNTSMDLIRYPQLRKNFIIITLAWTANITAYYGLAINVHNLAGNEFLNFFLVTLVEIPGYLLSWFVMERFGRRWCSVAGFMLTGIICLLACIESDENAIACSIIGKFFAGGTFMATYQQSSEIYPTVIRSLGMGLSCTFAFIITFAIPYVIYLNIYGKWIPFLIIGVISIVAAVAVSFLPETLNENLPQTISDAEEFGKNQKYFSCNRRQQSAGRARASSFGLSTALESFGSKEVNDNSNRQPSPAKESRVTESEGFHEE